VQTPRADWFPTPRGPARSAVSCPYLDLVATSGRNLRTLDAEDKLLFGAIDTSKGTVEQRRTAARKLGIDWKPFAGGRLERVLRSGLSKEDREDAWKGAERWVKTADEARAALEAWAAVKTEKTDAKGRKGLVPRHGQDWLWCKRDARGVRVCCAWVATGRLVIPDCRIARRRPSSEAGTPAPRRGEM
jgi:hypothetical protein